MKLTKTEKKFNWDLFNIISYSFIVILMLIQDKLNVYPKPSAYNIVIAFICGVIVRDSIKSFNKHKK